MKEKLLESLLIEATQRRSFNDIGTAREYGNAVLTILGRKYVEDRYDVYLLECKSQSSDGTAQYVSASYKVVFAKIVRPFGE